MDLIDFGRYAAGLAITLGLIALLAYGARRFNWLSLPGGGLDPRLKVAGSVMLDARRRAVILRFDGKEHLILLGANGETVIETRDAGSGDEA